MEHVTVVTIQDSDSTHRRVFSNRQQWFAHRRLNTSNSEVDSPIVTTFNVHSLTSFDKLSGRCAESEITVARNHLPVRDTLRPCRLSCTCVDSNLDPFTLLLLKCINIEKTHLEFTDFNFWFNICCFRRVKIVSIRCILGFVLSFRITFVGVLLTPTVFRVVSALFTIPAFNRILALVLVLTLVASLLSLLSLLPFAFALGVLARALFALAIAKRTGVHWVVSSCGRWCRRPETTCAGFGTNSGLFSSLVSLSSSLPAGWPCTRAPSRVSSTRLFDAATCFRRDISFGVGISDKLSLSTGAWHLEEGPEAEQSGHFL